MTKYIFFVTGGVVSGFGKGITACGTRKDRFEKNFQKQRNEVC